MTNIELINLIVKYTNNNTRQAIHFIRKDCSINFKIEVDIVSEGYPWESYNSYLYYISYKNKISSERFHNDKFSEDYSIYEDDITKVLCSIFEVLNDNEIEKIKNTLFNIGERNKNKQLKLNSRTLYKLNKLINEDIIYRKGFEIVEFFNNLGFNDKYGNGFPSRESYTKEKLNDINGTIKIIECIKNTFHPLLFLESNKDINEYINDFNKYLMYDKLEIINNDGYIEVKNLDNNIKYKDTNSYTYNSNFEKIYNLFEKLNIDDTRFQYLNLRMLELKSAIKYELPLSIIFLSGSILEGVLLYYAIKYRSIFMKAKNELDNNKKDIEDLKLNDFINIAHKIGLIKKDSKDFSHILRDYRNYIHPNKEMRDNFNPDINTATLCYTSLIVILSQILKNKCILENNTKRE